jgi:hypothetical protein
LRDAVFEEMETWRFKVSDNNVCYEVSHGNLAQDGKLPPCSQLKNSWGRWPSEKAKPGKGQEDFSSTSIN